MYAFTMHRSTALLRAMHQRPAVLTGDLPEVAYLFFAEAKVDEDSHEGGDIRRIPGVGSEQE